MPWDPKSDGRWWAVTCELPAQFPLADPLVLDAVSRVFYAEGATGLEFEDGIPGQAAWVDDPAPAASPFVRAYFPDDERWPGRLGHLKHWAQDEGHELQVRSVWEADWANAWKQFFHAVRPGRRLWIVPAWEDPPDPTAPIIRIDPGMAFGTGTHATTALMIRLLEDNVVPGSHWLDVGTGSGILALAAWRLGATVTAVDVDPLATSVATANFAAHGAPIPVVTGTVSAVPATVRECDGLAANLTAGIILHELQDLLARVRSGGVLLLSGIIEDRWPQVEAALRLAGCGDARVSRQDGWLAVQVVRG